MRRNIFTTKLVDIEIPDTTNFDKIFLVMDYQVMDLKKLFRDPKPPGFTFDEEHFKVVFYNLLCSLNFIHSANIIHRDLKPGNILIDQECNVVICDFGLARSLPESGHKRSFTTHVASRWYRAPELILDQEDYDYQADIWSMGCILGELIAYSNPYRSKEKVKAGLSLFKGSSCYPLSPCDLMLKKKD
jgi:serine/threonine protein kinase